jgi:hypothetical protein
LPDFLEPASTLAKVFNKFAVQGVRGHLMQILDPAAAAFTNFTHVDNILDVKNNTIKLKYKPEFLIFVSKKKKQ